MVKRGRKMIRVCLLVVMLWASPMWAYSSQAQVRPTLAAPGEAVATIHAEGAQIYECKADSGGKVTWLFREPVATLLLNGNTIGRHYAGPTWELTDGSVVIGKTVSNAPGATAADIPWLKTGCGEPSGQRPTVESRDCAADEHPRRRLTRYVRSAWQLSKCSVFGRL